MNTLEAQNVTPSELDGLQALTQSLPAEGALQPFLQKVADLIADGANLEVVRDDKQLTPAQAARILGVSRPHVYKLMDRGDLPFIRVGSDRRTTVAEVREFARNQEEERKQAALRAAHPRETRAAAIRSFE